MSERDDLSREEQDVRNQETIEALRLFYATQEEDEQSLARIGTRIRQRRLESSTAATMPKIIPLPIQEEESPLPTTQRPARRPRSKWRKTFEIMAAVLILSLLSASLLLMLAPWRSSPAITPKPTPTPDASLFTLQPGWHEVAVVSGTGSTTIDDRVFTLNGRIGLTLICSDPVQATLTLPQDDLIKMQCKPQGSTEGLRSPAFLLDNKFPEGVGLPEVIAFLKVNIPAKISWHLQITEGPYRLQPEKGEKILAEFTHKKGEFTPFPDGIEQQIESGPISPELRLHIQCYGRGQIHYSVEGDNGTSGDYNCDGNGDTMVISFATPSKITKLSIITSSDNYWEALLAQSPKDNKGTP